MRRMDWGAHRHHLLPRLSVEALALARHSEAAAAPCLRVRRRAAPCGADPDGRQCGRRRQQRGRTAGQWRREGGDGASEDEDLGVHGWEGAAREGLAVHVAWVWGRVSHIRQVELTQGQARSIQRAKTDKGQMVTEMDKERGTERAARKSHRAVDRRRRCPCSVEEA
eukprot:SAG11_NODE_1549_length_4701_cov_1.707518_5_plen_167_part_00